MLALASVHLSKQSPLSDLKDLLWQEQFLTSHLSLVFWMGQLVVSLGRQGLLIKVSIWQGHCPYSEVRGCHWGVSVLREGFCVGSLIGQAAGCALQPAGVTSWSLQLPLVRQGC